MNSIFTRRSIREYDSCPVEQEKLERILRAGMQAPSAMNRQPWEFLVVKNPEMIQKIAALTPYGKPAARAPVVLVPGQSSNRRGEKSFLGTGSVSQRTEYPAASYRRGPRRMLDGHLSG